VLLDDYAELQAKIIIHFVKTFPDSQHVARVLAVSRYQGFVLPPVATCCHLMLNRAKRFLGEEAPLRRALRTLFRAIAAIRQWLASKLDADTAEQNAFFAFELLEEFGCNVVLTLAFTEPHHWNPLLLGKALQPSYKFLADRVHQRTRGKKMATMEPEEGGDATFALKPRYVDVQVHRSMLSSSKATCSLMTEATLGRNFMAGSG
jgi:hypothetical protein